jgi:hypothetical protein
MQEGYKEGHELHKASVEKRKLAFLASHDHPITKSISEPTPTNLLDGGSIFLHNVICSQNLKGITTKKNTMVDT